LFPTLAKVTITYSGFEPFPLALVVDPFYRHAAEGAPGGQITLTSPIEFYPGLGWFEGGDGFQQSGGSIFSSWNAGFYIGCGNSSAGFSAGAIVDIWNDGFDHWHPLFFGSTGFLGDKWQAWRNGDNGGIPSSVCSDVCGTYQESFTEKVNLLFGQANAGTWTLLYEVSGCGNPLP
jgi:hypothetical protein